MSAFQAQMFSLRCQHPQPRVRACSTIARRRQGRLGRLEFKRRYRIGKSLINWARLLAGGVLLRRLLPDDGDESVDFAGPRELRQHLRGVWRARWACRSASSCRNERRARRILRHRHPTACGRRDSRDIEALDGHLEASNFGASCSTCSTRRKPRTRAVQATSRACLHWRPEASAFANMGSFRVRALTLIAWPPFATPSNASAS